MRLLSNILQTAPSGKAEQRTKFARLLCIRINVFPRRPSVDGQSQHTVIMAFRGVEDQLVGPVPFDGKPQLNEIADLPGAHEQVIGARPTLTAVTLQWSGSFIRATRYVGYRTLPFCSRHSLGE
jgi:hypothetical protein